MNEHQRCRPPLPFFEPLRKGTPSVKNLRESPLNMQYSGLKSIDSLISNPYDSVPKT